MQYSWMPQGNQHSKGYLASRLETGLFCEIVLFIYCWTKKLTTIDFYDEELEISSHTTVDTNMNVALTVPWLTVISVSSCGVWNFVGCLTKFYLTSLNSILLCEILNINFNWISDNFFFFSNCGGVFWRGFLQKIHNRYHTDVERAQIVAFHKNGLSQRQISKQLSINRINRSSAQRAFKKFTKEGVYENRKKW